jgi:hypothetical protein
MTRQAKLHHRQKTIWKAYLALKEMHPFISVETVRRLLSDIEEVQRERPSAVELWLKEGWIWEVTPKPMTWE